MANHSDIKKFLAAQVAIKKERDAKRRADAIQEEIKQMAWSTQGIATVLALLPVEAREYAVGSFENGPAKVSVSIPECYPIVIGIAGGGKLFRAVVLAPEPVEFPFVATEDFADIVAAAIVDQAQLPGPQGDPKA